MEIELTAEAKDRRLNRLVAITVVVLSVFTGICNIKDGNLVQAMQQAKADSVDTWGITRRPEPSCTSPTIVATKSR